MAMNMGFSNKMWEVNDSEKITMVTLFYPLFDAQFVTNRKQLALVYMQYIDSFAKYGCNIIDV